MNTPLALWKTLWTSYRQPVKAEFYIYRETKRNNQINDKLTVKPNVIFDVLVQKDPYRVHTSSLQPDNLHIPQS